MLIELFVKPNEPSLAVLKYVRESLPQLNRAGHRVRVENIKRIDTSAAAMLKNRGIASLPSLACGNSVIAGARSIIIQLGRLASSSSSSLQGGAGRGGAAPMRRAREPEGANDWMAQEIMSGVRRKADDKGRVKYEVEGEDDVVGDDDALNMRDIEKMMAARMGAATTPSKSDERSPPQRKSRRAPPPADMDDDYNNNVEESLHNDMLRAFSD